MCRAMNRGNNVKTRQHTSVVTYLSLLLVSLTVAAQETGPANERYRLLGTRRISTMRKELEEAVAAGYRVQAGTLRSTEITILLKKAAEPSDSLEYVLLDERRIRDLRKRLNELGAEGFRLLPTTVMQADLWSGEPILAVMEKSHTGTYEYIVQEDNLVSSSEEINEVANRGYNVVGAVNREDMMTPFFAIFEKAGVSRAQDSVKEDEVSTQPRSKTAEGQKSGLDQRYLTTWDSGTGSVRKKIDKAAAKGYRVVLASRVYYDYGEDHRKMAVILEKVAAPPDTYKYMLLADSGISTLEKELNEAASAGFRLVPCTVISKDHSWMGDAGTEIVAVMENPPAPAGRYEYLLLSRHGTDSLPEGMAHALDLGYQVVAMVSLYSRLVLFLEKTCSPEGPVSDQIVTDSF
jgi:hypothetical protein